MSIHEILDRIDVIYKKYEKYVNATDSGRGGPGDGSGGRDAFGEANSQLLGKLAALQTRCDEAAAASDRAVRAGINADIRRGKAALLEGDIPNLERLARKGLRRAPPGTSAERAQKIAAAKDAVAALADGLHAPAKRYFPASSAGGAGAGGGPSSSSSSPSISSSSSPNPSSSSSIQALKAKGKTVIMLDETKWGSRADADGYYSQSETAAGFRKEFEDAAARQDRGALADIERGLGELSQIAGAVGDALADQAVLAVAVEEKVAEASRGVKKSNVRMKSMLGQLRTSRNFCLDATLFLILVTLVLYIYSVFAKR